MNQKEFNKASKIMSDILEPTTDKSGSSATTCSPMFFAGWYYIEEEAQGGMGESIEEAVDDYFRNHADDEVEDAYQYEDSEDAKINLKLQIFRCQEDGEGWVWFGSDLVETRHYVATHKPNPKYQDVLDWEYSPANAKGLTSANPNQKTNEES